MKNSKRILTAILICTIVLLILTACNKEPEPSPEPHTHVFGERLEFDGESHWKKCECGEISEKSAHTHDDGVKEYGKITYTCTECGNVSVMTYDTNEVASSYLGASTSIVANTIAARYEYNSDGKLIRVRHYAELPLTEGFYYGIFNEVVREVYEYDEEGRLLKVSVMLDPIADRTGAFGLTGKEEEAMRFVFESDDRGKPQSAKMYVGLSDVPLGKVDMTYGEDGVISKAVFRTMEQTIELVYEKGKLAKIDGAGSFSFSYKASGNIAAISGDRNVEFKYKDGAVDTITEALTEAKGSVRYEYTYNDDGTLKSIYMRSPNSNVSSKTTYFGYDSEKRVVSITPCNTKLGEDTTLFAITVEYNAAGKMDKHMIKIYDNTTIANKYTVEESTVTYGENGKASRIESIVYENTAPDQPLTKLVTEYEYTEEGRSSVQRITQYQKRGDTGEQYKTSDSTITMTYDSEGRFDTQTVTGYRYNVDGDKINGSKSTMSILRNETGYTDDSVVYEYSSDDDSFKEKTRMVNTYDFNGTPTSTTTYDKGEITGKHVYGFDKDGEPYIKQIEQYNDDGTRELSEMDEWGFVTKYVVWNADGTVSSEYKLEYVLDGNGNTIGGKEYDNGKFVSEMEFATDSEGERYVKKATEYYDDGKVFCQAEYNEQGDCVKYVEYDAEGKTVAYEVMEYEYYENGYVYLQKIYNEGGKLVCVLEYQGENDLHYYTEYDENGHITLKETYEESELRGYEIYNIGSNGQEFVSYSEMHYSSGGYDIYEYCDLYKPKSHERYTVDGDCTSLTEYQYDAEMNMIGSTVKGYSGKGTNSRCLSFSENKMGADGQLYLYKTEVIDPAMVEHGIPEQRTVTIYLENGLKKSTTIYDADGNIISHQEFN